ncbi:MAG: molybdopterin/thiamine biosynthesis adenylyltransferase/rhodanese-related sulfurtransferase [Flavobacteriaceae bacterium]|jgi:molybdopterin/thiamine biosynthesis adenylyltransferase/rhodanese-related sulfurtransferase
MTRYSRHIILSEIGQEGQDRLSKSKVLVVGAGGLGCPVLQYLTGAGIGTIGIIDFDTVSESNLQRQILFGASTLGINKAIAAKARLEDLNNTILIKAYPEKLTYKNALSIFQDYDIIVDGTDNFSTRYLVNDASIITNKPLVYAGIYKFEGQVSVFNYKKGPSYRCLFPKQPENGSIPNCSEIGVLGVLPGIIGTLQANEVIKLILGIGEVLSGKVLYYNSLNHQINFIKVNRSKKEIQKVMDTKTFFETLDKESNCEMPIQGISIQDAINKKNIQWIDVRDQNINPEINHSEVLQIPLNDLEQNLNKIDLSKEQVIFCQAGIKSKKAASILQSHQIHTGFSLKNGAYEVLEYFNNKNYDR